jgi:hypothetical protein
MINAILRLRRDNDYNYAKIKNTFIPAKGEICLIDTAREGLKAVCGDGVTPFGMLEYFNELIVFGYYNEEQFYKDQEFTIVIPKAITKIYIDKITNSLYYYDGIDYIQIGGGSAGPIPTATANKAGIMKLYDTLGDNTDGTMTQKAITDELNEKVEVEVYAE